MAAFFVAKTGIDIIDKMIMVFTAVLPMLITESQRSYSRFSSVLGKRIVKACIALATFGISFIGLSFFLQAGLASFSQVYLSNVLPQIHSAKPWWYGAVYLAVLMVATPIAMFRVFHGTQYWDLIYHVPRRRLIRLLVGRKYKTDHFFLFAHFELSVLALSFVYAHVIAGHVRPYIQLFRTLS